MHFKITNTTDKQIPHCSQQANLFSGQKSLPNKNKLDMKT